MPRYLAAPGDHAGRPACAERRSAEPICFEGTDAAFQLAAEMMELAYISLQNDEPLQDYGFETDNPLLIEASCCSTELNRTSREPTRLPGN